ncbi:MAG: hypothetical protein HUJ58_05050 [Erysipelotrichaceae bacterium]|nr:hypothetical protein [Erysipelotrichaceae bacterium]
MLRYIKCRLEVTDGNWDKCMELFQKEVVRIVYGYSVGEVVPVSGGLFGTNLTGSANALFRRYENRLERVCIEPYLEYRKGVRISGDLRRISMIDWTDTYRLEGILHLIPYQRKWMKTARIVLVRVYCRQNTYRVVFLVDLPSEM